jgi:DNA-binding NarL/FixJ family response regulator
MLARVLIADDSEVIRGLIRTSLETRASIKVCGETRDGQETVDRALRLEPDLIILDVLMPKLNGIEVASILKKNLPSAKIILFTMYGEYVKTLAYSAGVDIVLPKPDGLSPLIEAIDSVMAGTDAGSLDVKPS